MADEIGRLVGRQLAQVVAVDRPGADAGLARRRHVARIGGIDACIAVGREEIGEVGACRLDRTPVDDAIARVDRRSEEHTSELQSLMRISYAVFCLKKKK